MFDHHLKYPERIITISDSDFFNSLTLEGMEGVPEAVGDGAYGKAYEKLWHYLQNRDRPVHPYFQDRAGILERIPRNQRLADLILEGKTYRIDTTEFDFSGPIDFDSISGVTTKHGFHYLTWMECLLHAAIEHGERGYLVAYRELFLQWYEQRESIKRARASNDVVFYELGLSGRNVRLMGFIYCCLTLGAEDVMTPKALEYLLKNFLGAARWLQLEQEEKGYREGNWQLFAVRYLLQFGILFPEFKEASLFRSIAAELIEAHIEKDFYEDGGHSERCFSYGSAILGQLDEFIRFTECNPHLETPQSFDWKERVAPLFEWYLKTVAPGPEFPGFGDGEFLRITRPFTSAWTLFDDSRYLWPIRHQKAEWQEKAQDPGYRSVLLPSSEFCVLRDGFGPEDNYCFINYGGFPGGHSHQDLLDFTLYSKGVPLAADVARFNGYDQPWDLYFRSPQAHNQFTVEGAVMERQHYRGEAVRFSTTEKVDCFSAIHKAYLNTAGIVMERRIVFLKPVGYLIFDTASKVSLEPEHAIYRSARNSYLWHLHAPYPFQIREESALASEDSTGLLVIPTEKDSLKYGYTGIDYLEENTEEFPHWKGREEPILWPNRYFLNLRTWYRDHASTPLDVALVPYQGAAPEASLQTMSCRLEGQPSPTVRPRALTFHYQEDHYQILIGDSETRLDFEGGQFTGHQAVIHYHRQKPAGIFIQESPKLEIFGKTYSTQSSQWIDLQ